MNTLISIGWLGVKSCYLNISLEEAKSRYLKDNPEEADCLDREGFVGSFQFEDEFLAYSVYETDKLDPGLAKKFDFGNSDGTDNAGNKYELAGEGEDV